MRSPCLIVLDLLDIVVDALALPCEFAPAVLH